MPLTDVPAALLSLGAGLLSILTAQRAPDLFLSVENEELRVQAPKMNFLTGKPLERLHDGAAVLYIAQLSLSTDRFSSIRRRIHERFAVSFDLWEERFAVARLGPARQSVSRLSGEAAQAWCMDRIRLPVAGITRDADFWVRLEVRAEDPREAEAAQAPAISLARLVEIFSRPPRDESPRWALERGPLRLADLNR
jgi:hypothetical protein